MASNVRKEKESYPNVLKLKAREKKEMVFSDLFGLGRLQPSGALVFYENMTIY